MAEQLPIPGGRGIRRPQRTPVSARDSGIIGPSAEEIEDVNSGRQQYKSLVSISGSAAAKGVAGIAAVTAGTAAVLEMGHRINEDIPNVPAIYRSIQDYRHSLTPSVGAEFHPNANKGVITGENKVIVPLEEALQKVKTESEENKRFAILPVVNGNLEYRVEGNYIKIKGLEAGTTIVSPYDGFLEFQIYENNGSIGGYAVNIYIGEDLAKRKVENRMGFGARDIKLLFPEDSYSVQKMGAEGYQTTLSSLIPVKAGQPIFELQSSEPMLNVNGDLDDYQLQITRADILSENDKAITASPQ